MSKHRSSRQVEPSHYGHSTYDTKGRYASYWHQIDAVLRRAPKRILEIGVGNGFVSRRLREQGIHVDTLDIDVELDPTVTGHLTELPFCAAAFDLVLCCQVLEHIPFEDSVLSLAEFRRVARRNVIVSVPDRTPRFRLLLPVPGRSEIEIVVRNWLRPRPRAVSDPTQHHWELGTKHMSIWRLREAFAQSGLVLERDYCVFEQLNFHFFELAV